MRAPLAFLKFVARAALNAVGFGVAGDFAVEVLPDLARDVWQWWGQGQREEQLRAETQAVAQVPDREAPALAAQAVAEEADGRPEAVRQTLTAYLTQVPAAIRRSQRRPADPAGRTVAADLPLRGPDDVLRFLPARLPRFHPGDRPAGVGDWVLEELLGAGGFSEVWKARSPYLPEPAALKFCLDPAAAQWLRHEAALLSRVISQGSHPGIIRLRHTYLDAATPCLEYEHVAGGDLSGVIACWRRTSGDARVEASTRLMRQLAGIVAFAHRLEPPIVHRDLKPANVLLQPTGRGTVTLRVADFGIGGVAARQASGQTRRGTTRGEFLATALRGACTPLYASPQQMRGEPPDPRDDVNALGVIWYQLLTGDLLAGTAADWQEELLERRVPGPVVDLLGRCLASRADRRPTDAAVLAEELAGLLPRSAPAAMPAEMPQAVTAVLAAPAPPPGNDLAAQVRRTLTGVREVHLRARQMAEQWHDYAEAARLLAEVPEHLRDRALYESVCRRRDRVAQLEREIRAAVEAARLSGLGVKVEELLGLTPGSEEMRRLRAVLPEEPREIVNSIGMRLVLIPAGTFLMGSPDSEAERCAREGPQHEVEITRPFYLGAHPVTQQQYESVMGRNPSWFARTGRGRDAVRRRDTRAFPVESVSWEDVVAFCRKLSNRPEERENGRVYALPTEAEWEYACRGGVSAMAFSFGVSLSSLQANFDGDHPYGGAARGPSLQRTTAVGSYPANAFGLYDMHGNVWEWCADWYSETYYAESLHQDPRGPRSGDRRVLRGGDWFTGAASCRSAARDSVVPGIRNRNDGFRVLLRIGVRASE